MTEISFRRANVDDLAAIIRLLADDPLGEAREVLSDPPDARYVDAFRAIDEDPNQLLAVADDNGTIAGCLQLTFLPGLSRTGMWRGQIESVRVGAGLSRRRAWPVVFRVGHRPMPGARLRPGAGNVGQGPAGRHPLL